MPKVSVIMPVYNTSKFLKESIESILHQDFQDFEFIIVDDASTDNSYEILEQYA
jgi:glycosyltransferase involved in cell wall biosynthesis